MYESRSNEEKRRSNGENCARGVPWAHYYCIFKLNISNFWAWRERSMSATFPQMSSPRAHYDRTKSATWARRERLKTSLKWGTTELSVNCLNVRNDQKWWINIVTVEKRIFCKIKNIFVIVLKTFIIYFFIGARGGIKWGANELTLLIASWALLFPIWAPSQNVRFFTFF